MRRFLRVSGPTSHEGASPSLPAPLKPGTLSQKIKKQRTPPYQPDPPQRADGRTRNRVLEREDSPDPGMQPDGMTKAEHRIWYKGYCRGVEAGGRDGWKNIAADACRAAVEEVALGHGRARAMQTFWQSIDRTVRGK